ncbi:E3 ubiquitin-protein ligase SMURF2 [Astathelohania contejeani]|uniref:HECT-type E3 ubiquitin transferase n=1 Tax=Astathelohania contejeani TaxID=164912 RepID=A0ABQ7I1U9_9MICR|nr:E3 ubiquitin-protein ligase SMURF2 [Thelohania contejeani]
MSFQKKSINKDEEKYTMRHYYITLLFFIAFQFIYTASSEDLCEIININNSLTDDFTILDENFKLKDIFEKIINNSFSDSNIFKIYVQEKKLSTIDLNWLCFYFDVIEMTIRNDENKININYWNKKLGSLFFSKDFVILKRLSDHLSFIHQYDNTQYYLKYSFPETYFLILNVYISQVAILDQKTNFSEKKEENMKDIEKRAVEILILNYIKSFNDIKYINIFKDISKNICDLICANTDAQQLRDDYSLDILLKNFNVDIAFKINTNADKIILVAMAIKRITYIVKYRYNAYPDTYLHIPLLHWIIQYINYCYKEIPLVEKIKDIKVIACLGTYTLFENINTIYYILEFFDKKPLLQNYILSTYEFYEKKFFNIILETVFFSPFITLDEKQKFLINVFVKYNENVKDLMIISMDDIIKFQLQKNGKFDYDTLNFLEFILMRISNSDRRAMEVITADRNEFNEMNYILIKLIGNVSKYENSYEDIRILFIAVLIEVKFNSDIHLAISKTIIERIFRLTILNYPEYYEFFNVYNTVKSDYQIKRNKLNLFKKNIILDESKKSVLLKNENQFKFSISEDIDTPLMNCDEVDANTYNPNEGNGCLKYKISLFSDVLKNDINNLFECLDNNLYIPCLFTDETFIKKAYGDFEFIGSIIGYAITTGNVISIKFPLCFYKLLLGKPISLVDVNESKNFDQLKALKEAIINNRKPENFDISLKYTTYNNEHYNSINISLNMPSNTILNMNAYEKCLYNITAIITENLKKSVLQIHKGMLNFVDSDSLRQLNEDELKYLICGEDKISVNNWKCHSIFNRIEKDSREEKWFWNLLKNFDQSKLKNILFAITGLKTLPFGGFSQLDTPFQIVKIKGEGILYSSIEHNTLYISSFTNDEMLLNSLEHFVSSRLNNSRYMTFFK